MRAPRFGGLVDRAAKRTFDLVVAGLLLLFLLPVILVTGILIVIDSPGPVFFRARRVGFNGGALWMAKFRKMRDGATGLGLSTDQDERFTRMGIWLAKAKFDEIPQLWHVVRGDMSLVGPRPEDPEFVAHHSDAYSEILSVRPGMTGLSQLAFAEEGRILDLEDPLGHYMDRLLPQKVSMDQLYARERTFSFDVRILWWTLVAVVLRRQVAVHRATGKMNLRRRPAA